MARRTAVLEPGIVALKRRRELFRRRFIGKPAGSGASASEQLLTLATDDGWTALWDPTNSDTLTVRNDGSDDFASAISDGMEAEADFVQSTASAQPLYEPSAFGQLDGLGGDGTQYFDQIFLAAPASQPDSWALVFQFNGAAADTDKRLISGGGGDKRIIRYDNGNVEIWAGSFVTVGTVSPGDKVVLAVTFDGASTSVIFNGTETTINPGSGGLDRVQWMSNFGSNSFIGRTGPLVLGTSGVTIGALRSMSDKLHDLTGIAKS